MKRKLSFLFAVALCMTMALPVKAHADGLPAVAYTEDGVQYGYFGDELSSDDMAEMKTLLEPWKNEIKNLDIDSLLSPARNGDETGICRSLEWTMRRSMMKMA